MVKKIFIAIAAIILGAEVAYIKQPAPVSFPRTLTIPKLNIKAEVETVGLDKKGAMDIPKNVMNVAWYNLGPKPGENGNAVIAGHLDTITLAPAVFYNLKDLEVGDKIVVTDRRNNQIKFTVYNKESYPYNEVPIQEVFGDTGKRGLNLITCVGTWDENTSNYSERLVVFTQEDNFMQSLF